MINLQPNTTYLLTRAGDDDSGLNGDLDVLDSVTISGAGPASTIIDGNGGATLAVIKGMLVHVADDCSGSFTSQGNDIVTNVIAAHCTISGSYSNAAASLGPLQDNGGPTLTHALPAGSAAIDAGDPGGCTDNYGAILTTDQRGESRPSGAACDIGAFELHDAIFQDGFDP